jgi:hypothetical protein
MSFDGGYEANSSPDLPQDTGSGVRVQRIESLATARENAKVSVFGTCGGKARIVMKGDRADCCSRTGGVRVGYERKSAEETGVEAGQGARAASHRLETPASKG